MSYPGNPSLAEEIQKKILGTYRQTLDLAESGKREEALLGCDFIHRLDPDFEPVLALQERLESETGAVPVDDLRTGLDRLIGLADEAAEADEMSIDAETADEAIAAPAVAESSAAESPSPEAAVVGDSEPDTYILSDDDTSMLESALDLSALGSNKAEAETPAEPTPTETASDPAVVDASAPEPSAALDQESADRVDELLAEGQAAFEQAEYQTAIDAWSRIFLIDIDHPEANQRIELARKLKAEVERKVDEVFHEAMEAMDSGSFEVASDKLRKVLELQPTHLAAQEHLDRIATGDIAEHPPETAADEPLEPAPAPMEDEFEEAIPASEFELEPMLDDPLADLEGEPSEVDARPAAPRRSSRRTVGILAGLGLVVGLAAIWFLWGNRERFFPNAEEEVAAQQQPARVDPIARAQALHLNNDTAMAISQLRRLPPAHPQYAEAQALIAQWETVLEVEQDDGPSIDALGERDDLVGLAREAFANREFLAAEEYFVLASQVAPLDDGALALQAETSERLEPLRREIEIFRQGEWEYALRALWRRYEEEPGNLDVLRLMIDAYYNLSVRELQRADPAAAIENLKEASSLSGDDPEIARLLDFATTYTQRSPDLLYRIFVKYLPFRS